VDDVVRQNRSMCATARKWVGFDAKLLLSGIHV